MDERPGEPFAMGMPSLAARVLIAGALQPIRPAIWPASIPERANRRKVWSSTSVQLIVLPKLYLLCLQCPLRHAPLLRLPQASMMRAVFLIRIGKQGPGVPRRPGRAAAYGLTPDGG